jgi:deazaflavin-dependent oxidoreductase (nitroreductase family)
MEEALAAQEFCYLTTTGRRSGRPHEIEIWFVLHGGRLYMISGGGRGSDWVRNLIADERVTVRVDGREFAGTARIVDGSEDEGVARGMLAEKYQGWRVGEPLSRWARDGLLIGIAITE